VCLTLTKEYFQNWRPRKTTQCRNTYPCAFESYSPEIQAEYHPGLELLPKVKKLGTFVPSDAPWVVHADFGTLVGGIRALLMQALHPGSLTGVKNHSRYESDPLGRLAGTIRWLTVTTFGSKTAVANEASRVNRLHERVKGEYKKGTGETVAYKAADKDLLLWVHIAFMESFLVSHQMYSSRAIPKGNAATGADNYIAQWSVSVAPLGLEKCPMNLLELDREITNLYKAGLLVSTPDTEKVVAFIKNPPLPALQSQSTVCCLTLLLFLSDQNLENCLVFVPSRAGSFNQLLALC
jgi:hypothetical protein